MSAKAEIPVVFGMKLCYNDSTQMKGEKAAGRLGGKL